MEPLALTTHIKIDIRLKYYLSRAQPRRRDWTTERLLLEVKSSSGIRRDFTSEQLLLVLKYSSKIRSDLTTERLLLVLKSSSKIRIIK